MGSKPDEREIHSSLESMIQRSPGKKRRARNFGGAFIVTATLMPMTATLLTVAVYFAISPFSYSRLTSIAGGAVLAVIFWLAMVIFVSPRATAERSDRYRYTLLSRKLNHLGDQLNIIQGAIQQDQLNEGQLATLHDAFAAFEDSTYRLYEERAGADWAWGIGYIELSKDLHRADEALIMFEPVADLVDLGSLLKTEIVNSKMSNPEQKLRSLEEALADLIPSYQKSDEKKVQADSSKDTLDESVKVPAFKKAIRETEVRAAIRDVSRSLHELEDDQQMKQVNLRIALNRLTLLTGLALYILLVFAILTGIQLSILISVTFFALIGACTGLLGRLYEQVKAETAVDSTSLAGVRLMVVPMLSGLAAIGGVALLQKVATTSGDFSFFLTPFNILAAAAFGLAPNLFFNALQRQVDAIEKGKQT